MTRATPSHDKLARTIIASFFRKEENNKNGKRGDAKNSVSACGFNEQVYSQKEKGKERIGNSFLWTVTMTPNRLRKHIK